MKTVGASPPRPDAYKKVTGTARYPADLVRPDMLHAAAVFAGRPHARILTIDAAEARAAKGVRAVLTAADVPYNRFGLIEADQPLLCDEVVRFSGDRVAVVVAESAALARRAAALVRVAYEDLPIVSDPREARKDGAPRVHEDRPNVLLHQKIRRGDVEAAFAHADVVVEAAFTTGWQEHAYLQPDAGIAYWEGDRLVVETAGQWLHEDRRQIAAMFAMPEERVVIRYAAIGGAFGGREDLSLPPLVALAAWKLKVPVAMVWNREESIIGHHKRHPYFITAKWGAKRDGTIVAAQTELVADGGAYASTSAEVLKCSAIFAIGPYSIENVQTDAIVCYTNNVPSGAFRGFGAPQAHFAAETMVTRLGIALGIGASEIRRQNLYREGDLQSTGDPLPAGVSVREVFGRCLAEREEHMNRLPQAADSPLRRGIGIACGIKNVGYSFGFPEQATATVELDVGSAGPFGATVRVGAAEVGQGVHLILRQIAAETLDFALSQVTMITDDSSQAPNAGSVSASRMTLMGGRAVKDAAEAALRNWRAGAKPRATVQYRPPRTTPLDLETGDGVPNYCYGYTAQAVEVEVDVRTGVTRVTRVISAHDVGRAINVQQVEGQIEGCIAQAVGYALTENFVVREGRVMTPHFSNYLLPTTLDVPVDIRSVILETADPNGPFGARGVAEMPLVPFAAAVAAAIYDATGAWVTDLPMTPERVLAAIDAARSAAAPAEALVTR
ncbi:MAG: xanthine dehydrogenase family protein [Candidatus Eremiobacteraeota bacterium]|nr:xanthine dehydrogenase family protein [Candidatus Eremiobacteraeota bacterium]